VAQGSPSRVRGRVEFQGRRRPVRTPAGEHRRQLLNAWIRSSGAFDAVFDFDRAVRDPQHPDRMLPAYDS